MGIMSHVTDVLFKVESVAKGFWEMDFGFSAESDVT